MILFLILFICFAMLLPLTLNEVNASSLMAGYNTMSDKEKEGVDLVPLLKYIKRLYPIISLLNLVLGILLYFFVKNEMVIIMTLISFIILSQIYLQIKSKQFYLTQKLRESNTGIYLLIGVFVFTLGLLSLNFLK